MEKFAQALQELSDEDWKTQMAKGYPNIPKGATVKVIGENFQNYYGTFCEVEYNGTHYYVDPKGIEFLTQDDLRKNEEEKIFEGVKESIKKILDERDEYKKKDYTLISDDDLLDELWKRCHNKEHFKQYNLVHCEDEYYFKGALETQNKRLEFKILLKNEKNSIWVLFFILIIASPIGA